MSVILEWHHETIGSKVVEALRKNRFEAYYAKDRESARSLLLNIIPEEYKTIGVGGSVTIRELNILELLADRGHILLDHGVVQDPEEKLCIRRQQLTSDCFLCGINAITLDGQIYNVDGTGNRIAAITFGPKKVIMVAGINKVTKDLAAARDRLAMIAGPMNSKRINANTPCKETGVCSDCQSPERICNVTHIMHKKPSNTDITVVIVGECLGY